MVRWLLCGFIFVVFNHFTKLNAMVNERCAMQCGAVRSNSKRIWLHLKCTMAFHSFNHLNYAQHKLRKTYKLTHTHTHTHTERKRERKNARDIHIKCIELALHFYCLFVWTFFPFVYSFFLRSSFVSFFFSLSFSLVTV